MASSFDERLLLRLAFSEDVGRGDLTTEACVPADLRGTAHVVAREPLVVAGQALAAQVFATLGARCEAAVPDGTSLLEGAVVARVQGPVRALLTGERLALNMLAHLSGIATYTRRHVEAAGGAFAIVDTRKTTPLHRAWEKAAVRAGGARNHRFGLDDGVLVKDNHLVVCGSVREAVRRVRASIHHLVRVEVEADTLEQALEAVEVGADAVLLDNMDDDLLARAIQAIGGRVLVEASGGMTIERIVRLREKGIRPDLVSVGGLVHRARWSDVSLDLLGTEAGT